MTAAPTASLIQQTTGGSGYVCDRINALLKTGGLKRFRVAVAYARWDGLGLVSDNLERFLASGGEFQCIYGVDNGVTTPDSFLYSLYLRELYKGHSYAGLIEDKYSNATFHPKFFEFKFSDRVIAVVGSANLTGGGFARNFEAAALIEVDRSATFAKELEDAWGALKLESATVTLERVRKLTAEKSLGSEKENEKRGVKAGKPAVSSKVKAATKPLFSKVLDLKQPAKKKKLLSGLDPQTNLPKRLYLQILPHETGGQKGYKGYQIQLPTVTLSAYFGVGPHQSQLAKFRFDSGPTISTHITHFDNNTHRVRLRPILLVARPAVLIFDRSGKSQYRCSLVDPANYKSVLDAKCTEQTRAGARRWGLE
ncbi:MAG: hypothetical protein ACRED9_01760 [Caulobacteraceae bacterium]